MKHHRPEEPPEEVCLCEVCFFNADDCICPECSVCHTAGDPTCYQTHGLRFTREQLIARLEFMAFEMEEQIHEIRATIEYIKQGGEFYEPEK